MALPPMSFGGDQSTSANTGGNITNGVGGGFPFSAPNSMRDLLIVAAFGIAAYLLIKD